MRILVTGGAGFVGSHTCVALLEKGYEVIVMDTFTNSNKNSLARVKEIVKKKKSNTNMNLEIAKGDIRYKSQIEEIFNKSKESGKVIDGVIHLAGLKSVSQSIINPIEYWNTNVNGAINLLNSMDKYECRKIVFSSSAAIYGQTNRTFIKETSFINPINPYGQTKATIENFLNDIYKSFSDKWSIVNLRYFNPIGAHSTGLIGEDPLGKPNNLFPYITQVANGSLSKLTVYGNDWETHDGTGVRDYIHIMDLAEGHLAALEYVLSEKSQIKNLNIGTGIGTSVLDLINSFEMTNKIKIPYEITSRRPGDVGTLIADNTLSIKTLNWSPKRSLKEMCIDGWKWQSLNPQGYNS